MLKYFNFLNRYAFYRSLPEQGKLAIILSLFVLLWVASGFINPSNPALKAPETLAQRTAHTRDITVQTKIFKPLKKTEIVTVRGSTQADRTVQLVAQTRGSIKALPVEKGQFVKANEIVCQIDVDARQAQLDEADALMRAKNIDYKAAQKLVEKGYFSVSRAASAKAAYDTAVALHKQRKIELDRTSIRAPFDGIYDTQPVEVGDFISIGQPCGSVVNKDPLLVIGQVSETQIGALNIGAKAKVKLVTGEMVEGRLTYMAAKADPLTRTFEIEVEIQNKNNALRDGISAEVSITGKERKAHLIPHSIISLSTDGIVGVSTVKNKKVKFVPITILSDDLSGLFILGLEGDAEIITVGQNFVKDGQEVKVQKITQSTQPHIQKTSRHKP